MKLNFLQKQQIHAVISSGCGQVIVSGVISTASWVIKFGFACSFGSTEVKKLFDFFMRMWLDMPKVIENKLVISQKYT